MKANIHPDWHHDCKVTCSCGNVFEIGSTFTELQVDICNACHPFFTGEMKFVDRQGRVDRFKQKVKKAEQTKAKQVKAKVQEDSKSYREILRDQQSALRSQAKQAQSSADKAASKKEN